MLFFFFSNKALLLINILYCVYFKRILINNIIISFIVKKIFEILTTDPSPNFLIFVFIPTSLILKFSYFDFMANSAPKKGPLVLILILSINFLLANFDPEEISL